MILTSKENLQEKTWQSFSIKNIITFKLDFKHNKRNKIANKNVMDFPNINKWNSV